MGKLDGKVAIVSGAASGIGRASAKLFAREGASVVATDRAQGVEETVREIHAAGGKAIALIGDTSDEGDVANWVATAISEFGGLDILYANAGVSSATEGFAPFLEQTPETWSTVLRINTIGPFLAIKHAAPAMIARGGGAIVCTASVAGIRYGAGPAHYSASKAGVMNLVSTAAQELFGTNVRVNGICPGLIETGMTKPVYDRARAKGTDDRIGQLNPLMRGGQPEEIAAAALFLVSSDASYVNGHCLVVDGGLSSSHPVAGRGKMPLATKA